MDMMRPKPRLLQKYVSCLAMGGDMGLEAFSCELNVVTGLRLPLFVGSLRVR